MGHVPSAGSRSLLSAPVLPPPLTLAECTSSLLHFSSSLSTKTLAMLLNICRHQDTYNRGRAQNSAFKQEPAPSPGTLTATATSECVFCRAARKTSPSGRAVPFKTVPLSPERMWIKECSLSVRRGFPTCHQDTETRYKVEGVSVPVYQHIDRSPAADLHYTL